jgi:ubiquinone biosynthesis protein COQ9
LEFLKIVTGVDHDKVERKSQEGQYPSEEIKDEEKREHVPRNGWVESVILKARSHTAAIGFPWTTGRLKVERALKEYGIPRKLDRGIK